MSTAVPVNQSPIFLLPAQERVAEIHSCEISRNAKGEYSFTVKAYGQSIEDAVDRALRGLAMVRVALEK
jgi:hypothetical protein